MSALAVRAQHKLTDDQRSCLQIATRRGPVTYSRFIGRVGALAVALGVGLGFTLGTPGLAWADDTESSSSPDPSPEQSSEPAPDQPDRKPSTGPGEGPETAEREAAQAEREAERAAATERKRSTDESQRPDTATTEPSDDTAPTQTEVSLPDAQEPEPTAPSLPVNTEPSDAPTVPREVEPPIETPLEPTTPNSESPTSDGPATPLRSRLVRLSEKTSGTFVTVTVDGTDTDSPLSSDGVEMSTFQATSRAVDAPTAGNSTSTQAISTIVAATEAPAPSPTPDTAANLVTAFVAAVLSPFAAPNPAAPAQPPLSFFAVLEWLRREINRTVFNQTPHAMVEEYWTSEGVDVTGDVLANDTDADGDALRASLVDGPDHGTLTLDADGTFVYTPDASYAGPDSFTYKVTDTGFHLHLLDLFEPDQGHSDTATVSIRVIDPDNNMPVTMGDNYTVTAGQTLTVAAPGVLANDNDIDGDPLTAVKYSDPGHGTVTLNPDGSFTYVADADFAGLDQFEYYATDGLSDHNFAYVNITVTQEALPVAGYDSFATPIDTSLTIDADALLANDFDNEGDPLTAIVTQAPANGTLVDNGDGTYTYTPDGGFIGTDVFEYVAADAGGESDPAVVSINVGIPANAAPVAFADFVTLRTDTARVITPADLVGNDTDADGDVLTPIVVFDPIHGTLEYNPGGTVTYTPDPGFSGYDSFYYTAFDGYADSAPTLVTLGVAGQPTGNTPPIAGWDSLGTAIDTPLTINPDTLLANDFDADGDLLWVSVTAHPLNGTLTTDAAGNLVYTPDAAFTGTDNFFYSAAQPENASLPAVVTINVGGPANTAPEASPDNLVAVINTPLTFSTEDLLWNDTDSDGDDLGVYVLSAPAKGTLAENGNGTFTYTPEVAFLGSVSFSYTAFDGQADSVPTLVTITVGGIPVQRSSAA